MKRDQPSFWANESARFRSALRRGSAAGPIAFILSLALGRRASKARKRREGRREKRILTARVPTSSTWRGGVVRTRVDQVR